MAGGSTGLECFLELNLQYLPDVLVVPAKDAQILRFSYLKTVYKSLCKFYCRISKKRAHVIMSNLLCYSANTVIFNLRREDNPLKWTKWLVPWRFTCRWHRGLDWI